MTNNAQPANVKAAELVQEIDALYEKATPGPWTDKPPPKDEDGFACGTVIAAVAPGAANRIYANPPGGSFPAADKRLILALVNRWPEIRALLSSADEQSKVGVVVPRDIAKLIRNVFLPTNPNKMRGAHPDTVAAAKAFIAVVESAAPAPSRQDAEDADPTGEIQAWREYAEHLEHCVECGMTGPENCADGGTLRAVARQRDRARQLSQPTDTEKGEGHG